MKTTGFIKKIDGLGRIVIPKSVRKSLGVVPGNQLEFFIDSDTVVLKKYGMSCVFCGSEDNTYVFRDKYVCEHCAKELAKD